MSTPPESGTTWTQGILSSLSWPAGDPPDSQWELSPWVDVRVAPVDDMLATLEAQPHRRFIKTHSPADCTPIFEECKYIVVYRDGRDAIHSWSNHRKAMRPELIDMMNESARAEGLPTIDGAWDGDLDALFDEWAAHCSSVKHFYHEGTNGRWQGVMTDEQLARYDQLVAEGLEPDAASWLESGSLVGGTRPPET